MNSQGKFLFLKNTIKSEAIAKIQGVLDKTEDIKVLVHTNPKVTSVPKKKPDIFECGIGGANPEEN